MNLIEHPLTGTPFGTALDLCLIVAPLVWLLGVITREYSWIDRLWSLLPPVYCLMVAAGTDFASPRVNLMTALVVLWGARLTFNFARKGGYWAGGEDYRWTTVREKAGPVAMQVMNLTFISFGQMLLIWLFTSPIHQASVWVAAPLGWLDYLTAAAVPRAVRRRDRGRRADVALPAGQETATRGGRRGRAAVHGLRVVPLLPTPQLLL